MTDLPNISWRDATPEEISMGIGMPLPVAEELTKRKAAAKKDKAMLGDSGYERIEADHYATPPEYLDCLLEHVVLHDEVWESASGEGNLSIRLVDFGHTVWSSDIIDYGLGDLFSLKDFFLCEEMPTPTCRAIVSNPPYETVKLEEEKWAYLRPLAERYGMVRKGTTTGKVSLAELFVRHALHLTRNCRGQVAMFLRHEFDCGSRRMDLFGQPPFHKKIVTTQRPRWVVGSTGSPRHNYAWFVWDWRQINGSASLAYSHPDLAPRPTTKES